jgi:hypothetical protein
VAKPFDADQLTAGIQVAKRVLGLPIAYIGPLFAVADAFV